ncbi:oligosaccharide flippase family protein [bacterium]|nr:oligosaccharide flippase family protein [bacterium]
MNKGKLDKDSLIKHGGILLIASLATGLLNFLFHIYMPRALDTADYGILASLLALYMIIAIPAGTISMATAKYVSGFKAENKYREMASLFFRSLKKLFPYSGLTIFIFILISPYLSSFLKMPSRAPIIVLGFALSLSLIAPVFSGALQGLQRFSQYGVYTFLAAGLKLLLGILLVSLGLRVNGALGGVFLAGIISLFVAASFLKPIFLWRKEVDYEVSSSEVYRYLRPVALALFCFTLLTYVDIVMVKRFFTPLNAGYYATASVVGKVFFLIPASLARAVFPKVSEKHTLKRDPYAILGKGLALSFLVCALGILICFFLPRPVVLIFGEKYLPIIPLIRVFGAAITPFSLTFILLNFSLARERTNFIPLLASGALLEIILLSLFHNTLLQVLFILGIVGSLMFLSLLSLILYEKKRVVT